MLDTKMIQYLESQFEQKFTFEEIDKFDLANQLILEIGNPDSHLRDEVIYPNLAHLLHDHHFTNDQLITITNRLISKDCLFYDLEQKIPYSTLTRTFTSLQLTILVFVHNRDSIYDNSYLKDLFNRYLDYYQKETDLRGYEKEVGWIHSIAHGADVFTQFAKCKELGKKEYERMFQAITQKFQVDHYSYVSDEDERTVHAIVNVLDRTILSHEFLLSWVEAFADYPRPTTFPEVYRIYTNVKSILRSLYFRLVDQEEYLFLTTKIRQLLKEKVQIR